MITKPPTYRAELFFFFFFSPTGRWFSGEGGPAGASKRPRKTPKGRRDWYVLGDRRPGDTGATRGGRGRRGSNSRRPTPETSQNLGGETWGTEGNQRGRGFVLNWPTAVFHHKGRDLNFETDKTPRSPAGEGGGPLCLGETFSWRFASPFSGLGEKTTAGLGRGSFPGPGTGPVGGPPSLTLYGAGEGATKKKTGRKKKKTRRRGGKRTGGGGLPLKGVGVSPARGDVGTRE